MLSKCVKVPKSEGEATRRRLVEAELLDNRLKIRSDEAYVYLPVIESLSPEMLSKVNSSLALTECDFVENERA